MSNESIIYVIIGCHWNCAHDGADRGWWRVDDILGGAIAALESVEGDRDLLSDLYDLRSIALAFATDRDPMSPAEILAAYSQGLI